MADLPSDCQAETNKTVHCKILSTLDERLSLLLWMTWEYWNIRSYKTKPNPLAFEKGSRFSELFGETSLNIYKNIFKILNLNMRT